MQELIMCVFLNPCESRETNPRDPVVSTSDGQLVQRCLKVSVYVAAGGPLEKLTPAIARANGGTVTPL